MSCIIILGYVDPGLGLLAWQALVAVFVGLLFYMRKTRDFLFEQARRVVRAVKKPDATTSSEKLR